MREADVATTHPSSDRYAAHFVRGIFVVVRCTALWPVTRDGEAPSPPRLRDQFNRKFCPLSTTIYPLSTVKRKGFRFSLCLPCFPWLATTLNTQRATHQSQITNRTIANSTHYHLPTTHYPLPKLSIGAMFWVRRQCLCAIIQACEEFDSDSWVRPMS